MSVFRMSVLYKALLSALLLVTAVPAKADSPDWVTSKWVNPSGKTVFKQAYHIACGAAPKVISYKTESNGIKYQGKFWVKRIVGCPTGRSSFYGYFEDFSVPSTSTAKREWCKGSLMMGMTGDEVADIGIAKWSNIKPAKKGYACKATGKTFSIDLTAVKAE